MHNVLISKTFPLQFIYNKYCNSWFPKYKSLGKIDKIERVSVPVSVSGVSSGSLGVSTGVRLGCQSQCLSRVSVSSVSPGVCHGCQSRCQSRVSCVSTSQSWVSVSGLSLGCQCRCQSRLSVPVLVKIEF